MKIVNHTTNLPYFSIESDSANVTTKFHQICNDKVQSLKGAKSDSKADGNFFGSEILFHQDRVFFAGLSQESQSTPFVATLTPHFSQNMHFV